MNRVEASNQNHRKDLGLVEMWLSGLKHFTANEVGESSVGPNPTISEFFNMSTLSQAVWRSLWEREVAGSIPAVSSYGTVAEVGFSACLKSRSTPVRIGSVPPCPIISVAENAPDERETVVRFHDWVVFGGWQSGRLRVAVDHDPKKHGGSNPPPSILRIGVMGNTARSERVIPGSWPGSSCCRGMA